MKRIFFLCYLLCACQEDVLHQELSLDELTDNQVEITTEVDPETSESE